MWYVAGMAKRCAARRRIYSRGSYKQVGVLAVITAVQPGELNEMSATVRLV
jgi:hypothetical protein